jgi:long-chain acyl-CoA synthetase
MIFSRWNGSSKLFLVENEHQFTYGQLYEAIADLNHLLAIPKSNKHFYVLEAEHTFHSYVRYLTLLFNGQKVLLCSKEQFADSSYLQLLSQEANEKFIPWGLGTSKPQFEQVVQTQKTNTVPELERVDESYFLVRTSGSSSKKFKLVLHSTSLFLNKYQMIGKHFEKTFAFSPAESVAGIETLLEVIAHDLILVSSVGDLAPSKVSELIRNNAVDYFQTTPTFMNLMILTGQVEANNLKGLKKIAYGSEPSQQFVTNTFREKLPNIELVHTYGMSEIGILKTITDTNDPSRFRFDPRFIDYKVVDGILEVKSMTKMIKYLNFEEPSNSMGAIWFNTSDQVIVEDDFLRILGRSGDLINVGGRKFFPSEIENLIRDLEDVKDITITTEKNEMIGTVIIANIVIEAEVDEIDFRMKFKNFCQEKIISYMHPHKIKIKREIEISPRFKKMRTS